MPADTTKPLKELSAEEIAFLLYNKHVELSDHALVYIETGERKVFITEELISLVERQKPSKAYFQQNGRYGIYYRLREGYRKLVLEIQEQKVVIVTYMDTDEIPKTRL